VATSERQLIQSYLGRPGVVLVGRGNQGAVYDLGGRRCIKVAHDRAALRREIEAMQRGQDCPYFPRLYEYGRGYMVGSSFPESR